MPSFQNYYWHLSSGRKSPSRKKGGRVRGKGKESSFALRGQLSSASRRRGNSKQENLWKEGDVSRGGSTAPFEEKKEVFSAGKEEKEEPATRRNRPIFGERKNEAIPR